jgi:hypothetical protein
MEIKVNDKDKLALIASLVGFIAFFIPWFKAGVFGQHSGYDLMSLGIDFEEKKAFLLLILPVSFLIIFLVKTQVIKNMTPILLKVVEIIPIAMILYSFTTLLDALGIRESDIKNMDSRMLEIISIGFPLTIISSILVAISPLKKDDEVIHSSNPESPKASYTDIQKDILHTVKESNYHKIDENIGVNVASLLDKALNSFKKAFQWLKSNPLALVAIGGVVIVYLVIWILFFKEYPKMDAEKLAVELCECYSEYDSESKKEYDQFLLSFESQNYVKRQDVRNKVEALENSIYQRRVRCTELVNQKY